MKVGIVILSHNRPHLIGDAVKSVLDQTVKPHRFVIAGNVGYPDVEFVESEEEPTARVNKVIGSLDCEAIAILCDDDKLDPMFIEKTSKKMEEGYDIVYTDMKSFGNENTYYRANEWNDTNIKVNTVPFITSLYRKSIWERAGGYDKVVYFDWDFWLKCFEKGATAACIHEPLFLYRRHNSQDSTIHYHNEARKEILSKHRL